MFNDFSHLYIERGSLDDATTQKIVAKFSDAHIIEIEHYKDVFNRPRQDLVLQQRSKKLILARKDENFLYKGPSIIQAFGCENLHYSAMLLGCPYSCDYCYLQGMYQNSNVVVFINIDDFIAEAKQKLKEGRLYVCLSYDSDLLALEKILGFIARWIALVEEEPLLTVEIRTKSANFRAISSYKPHERVIFATSLSPQSMIDMYEHGTASLASRLHSLKLAQECGWDVRLCFEPLLYSPSWKEDYQNLVEEIFGVLNPKQIRDLNCDIFRISPLYLKRIQKAISPSCVVWYPYEIREGLSTYSEALEKELKGYIRGLLEVYLPKEKIYD